MQEKFLLTLELRYGDEKHITKTITIGIYDNREEANIAGNAILEKMEKRFKINKNNGKQRLSSNGYCFGSPKNLVTNLGYLKTPFEFYLQVEKLCFLDVENEITKAANNSKEV